MPSAFGPAAKKEPAFHRLTAIKAGGHLFTGGIVRFGGIESKRRN
jgi:hypothetical protein